MTAAAEELLMTQPAVSQTIRELEKHYETKLFDRYPRRLEKGEIKELNVTDINLSRTLYLIKYPGKYLSQAVKDLVMLITRSQPE